MLRSHTCGELNLEDVGQDVSLCGWIDTKRDHGSLVFIDLKDRYGITQVTIHKKESGIDIFNEAKKIKIQSVVKITGQVRQRPKNTYNEEMLTGKIEIGVKEFNVLNESEDLPFETEKVEDVSEELKLKYRYLDIRKGKVLKNLILKHDLAFAAREFLAQEGFLELETPILTKSTPEGARDFLVPSRLMQGKFYALPQSPQIFKQIFMVAGADKYFQIARCFRDEDLRADRQPEFTQIDIECSFVDEEDIMNLTEGLFKNIFKKCLDMDLKTPFPRISYDKCLKTYQTDKPDIRKKDDDFAFLWVTDFPMFKLNHESGQLELEHHPFTSLKDVGLKDLEETEEKINIKARAYDLVLNGSEIGSGSIRIHNRKLQEKIFEMAGLSKEEYLDRFGFLLKALSLGAPPHGGIAFGADRLAAIMTGCASIRDVIAFPKTQTGWCPLSGAPDDIPESQLKDLKLKKEIKKIS